MNYHSLTSRLLLPVLAASVIAGSFSLTVSAKTTTKKVKTTSAAVATTAPTEAVVSQVPVGTTLIPLSAEAEGAQIILAYQELITGSEHVINETGEEINILSMAGGLEMLTSRAVLFSADPSLDTTSFHKKYPASAVKAYASDSAVTKARKEWRRSSFVDVTLPLSDVLNGRSLRDGETIGAVYAVNGYYYHCPVTVASGAVAVSIPKLHAELAPAVTFFIKRGVWTPGEGVDYLAIGNSITMHPKRDFWPNAMGMGATSIEKDYFNIVSNAMRSTFSKTAGGFQSLAMNFAIWESTEGNRRDALPLLDPYLSPSLDIISVQLGENFTDVENFATEYTLLLQYIHERCPNAKLILVGNYWQNDAADAVKQQLAQSLGAQYVSLSSIQNSPKYQFGIDSAVDANGVRYVLDNEGTAIHPNNAAMSYIAKGILSALQ